MDTQKFELDALSDDQLDAVAGGDAKEDAAEQARVNAENKKQADAVKGFQQMLQELP